MASDGKHIDQMKYRKRHDRMRKFAMRCIVPLIQKRLNLEAIPAPPVDGPFIVLSNHTLNLDPVLIHLSFSQMLYFVASEHVLRKGFGAWFLKRYFAPIPRLKGSTDISTVKGVLRRLKHGVSVCIFAEGNRSFDGVTGHIPISIAKLVKICRVPLLTYRFEGGYFTEPRWSTSFRRGRMKGYVVSVYDKETLADMSIDKLYEHIKMDLHEDAYARQMKEHVPFAGKRLAEALETTLYNCPACKAIGTMHSDKNKLICTCGLDVTYDEYGNLSGAPFNTITAWHQYQKQYLTEQIMRQDDGPLFSDEQVKLKSVTRARKTTTLLKDARLVLYRDRIECGTKQFFIENISAMANVGRNRILFTSDNHHYEWSASSHFCGRKYVEAYGLIKEGK